MVDLFAHVGQYLVQGFGLGDGARKAVQNKAFLGIGLLEAILDNADDHLVRDQLAGVHVFLGFFAHFGPLFHRGAQDIAGGNLGDLILVDKLLGLGAFAGPRSTQQDNIHTSLLSSCKL